MQAPLAEPISRFIVQALLIVGASRALGMGARVLRQPMVVAEIIAGIALGPSLLGRIWPAASHAIFPRESVGTLGLLSQFGLILFMLLVGLEFDPKLLRGRGRASVVISHASIVTPFVLGVALAYLLHSRLAPAGLRFTPFALFMGVAMSITAFPVLARILAERRLVRTRLGALVLACAAVDDVTAWCILAFVLAVTRSAGLASAVLTTVLVAAYLVAAVAVLKPALRRLAVRAARTGGPTRNQIALLLLATLVSAWITELIGIHALFGAFIVGALTPDTRGFKRTVAAQLEQLVVVLLLPLFFAYSGLRTQIGLLGAGEDWAICGLIVCVASLGKFGGGAVSARLIGMPIREATALGVLMNTRGLMELIVLNIGLDLGVISPKLFAMMVLMALVTTLLTTPILRWVYPVAESESEFEPVVGGRRRSGRVLRNAA